MKHFITLGFAATSLAAMVTFSSCSKNSELSSSTTQTRLANQTSLGTITSYGGFDRIDEIVKDLSTENYSLSFDKTNTGAGITRTSYGSDNYLVFADPQDLICPDPIRLKYPRVPIWKRPNFVLPTCPDMTIDIWKYNELNDLFTRIDPARFGALKGIKISNGGQLFASQEFLKSYASIQPDKLDALTKDLDASKFILMGAPDFGSGGAFQRNFYGYANLNDIVFKPYRINLKDLIKPTIKGCFDPLILQTIRERLARFNPAIYKGLDVSTLPQDKGIAVLH